MVNGIPIYLNQDLVLDLAALMFNGFEENRNVRNREEVEFHFRKTKQNRFQETREERAVVNNGIDFAKFTGEIELAKDVNSRILWNHGRFLQTSAIPVTVDRIII